MRPPRRDIAAPPFPPGIEWVGGAEPGLDRLLAAGPALVHFFDLAQLNSIRALPYLRLWHRRYGARGLSVLGVHSPRFRFTRKAATVAASLPRLQIDWPVAVDSELRVWRDYGCRGWPSAFLWGRGGTLLWHHLGEGEYEATELVIREALGAPPEGGWPPPVRPVRPGDEPGAEVIVPTEEVMPGGSLERPWVAAQSSEPLTVAYEAGGAYAAVDPPAVSGSAERTPGELRVSVDGGDPRPIEIPHPGLFELTVHPRHERHRLELDASPGLRVFSIQFAPAAAG